MTDWNDGFKKVVAGVATVAGTADFILVWLFCALQFGIVGLLLGWTLGLASAWVVAAVTIVLLNAGENETDR